MAYVSYPVEAKGVSSKRASGHSVHVVGRKRTEAPYWAVVKDYLALCAIAQNRVILFLDGAQHAQRSGMLLHGDRQARKLAQVGKLFDILPPCTKNTSRLASWMLTCTHTRTWAPHNAPDGM